VRIVWSAPSNYFRFAKTRMSGEGLERLLRAADR
jgi:hypothetical protein